MGFPDFWFVVVKMEGAALMREYWPAVRQASFSMSRKTSLHQSEKTVSLGTWSVCQQCTLGSSQNYKRKTRAFRSHLQVRQTEENVTNHHRQGDDAHMILAAGRL